MNAPAILATFFTPETIGTTQWQLLWLLPLAIAGIVVYKAIKMPQLTLVVFVKEVVTLLIFLVCLLLIITFSLFIITAWLT